MMTSDSAKRPKMPNVQKQRVQNRTKDISYMKASTGVHVLLLIIQFPQMNKRH